MKYINKSTGTMVEPPSELAAQSFLSSDAWEEYTGLVLEKPINKMTAAELTAKAEEHGIDISDCRTNSEKAAKITEVLAGGDKV